MWRFAFPILALLLLLIDGLVAGHWTNRWQTPDVLPAAAKGLAGLDPKLEAWKCSRLSPLNERIVAQAGFSGHVLWRFENLQSDAVVNVLLACGPFGPLCVHTPDVCFTSSGSVQEGSRELHSESFGASSSADFWKAKFGRPAALSTEHVRVFWSWNAGQGWQAPQNPRFTFGGAPVLYKLYIVGEYMGDNDTQALANCRALSRDLLPVLEKTLVFAP